MSRIAVAGLVLALSLASMTASARPLRPRFEPTDLELEEPGTVEVDVQAGIIQSSGPYRFVVPDLELDIGVLPNVEIDLDWSYAIEQPFDHSAQDNVWLAGKIGLYDHHGTNGSWAAGVQLGPRFGAAPGARGAGFEGLALLAYVRRHLQLAFDAGALVDPAIDNQYRPLAIELGLALALDLDARGLFSLNAALAGSYFFSIDPNQILVSLGFGWSPREDLSLSVTLVTGFLDGGDRIGALLGYSQKIGRRR